MRAEIPLWIIDDLYRRHKERPFDTGVPLYIPEYEPRHPTIETPEEDEDKPREETGDAYIIRF